MYRRDTIKRTRIHGKVRQSLGPLYWPFEGVKNSKNVTPVQQTLFSLVKSLRADQAILRAQMVFLIKIYQLTIQASAEKCPTCDLTDNENEELKTKVICPIQPIDDRYNKLTGALERLKSGNERPADLSETGERVLRKLLMTLLTSSFIIHERARSTTTTGKFLAWPNPLNRSHTAPLTIFSRTTMVLSCSL